MEPTMTIPTPEEESSESFSNENEDHPDVETITSEEEENNRIERSGTVADLSNRTDTEDVVDFSAAANETSTSDPDPEPSQTPEAITIPVTTEGNFLISKYNHLLSLRSGHTILPLSTSSFSYSSMLPPRPLGGFQEMHTEPAKPTSKRPRSSSSMESSSSEQIPATVSTTTMETEANATESSESTTTAELPTTIQLETPPIENEDFPDVTDFDLMEEQPTSDQTTIDKSRYTTLTVDRIDQDMDTDQEPTKSTRTPRNDSQTTPDELWWTPLPKYLENDTSTPSPKLPTKTPHEKKAQSTTKSGMKKVEKMNTPVPLARASAVGQFSYTTTVVPEFATLNEDLDDVDQTTVPELHLQQLSSELAFLGSSEVKRYVAEPPPAPLRLRYGKPKRRIAISRKKNNTKGLFLVLLQLQDM
ncbi:unnamed protein product [Nippostrongylus brasiliensis]|uniref:Flocculation protein FLO11-like n=1 Tax=Nippostrongylus brasiliensis TaxID=27835 RepID=A0A0N4YXR6_NIPBR|nr:unnamed protein product [Nippostrongylus brasiliensis]